MATEIRVGGVKYELAGTSDQGNVYVIQQSAETEVLPDIKHQETAIQTANGEYVINDIGELGEEAIIMFEEAGVGAEEVVSSNDYDLCFVDTGEVGESSGSQAQYQPLILTSDQQLGLVEEEVTTEIIKTEIQTEEDSDQFLVKHEVVEYEEDVKKVFVSKSSFEQPLNLVKKEKKGKLSVLPKGAELVICKLCNSYVVANKIDVHNRDMHGVPCHDEAKDRLTCPDCGKLFTSKRSLVGHKKEKHSGTLEIFPCVHCGKNFSRKANLKAHMDSIHFGKKFPCAYCERIFTNRSCMNLHVKKAHTETAVLSF